jgi:hypothetical protein
VYTDSVVEESRFRLSFEFVDVVQLCINKSRLCVIIDSIRGSVRCDDGCCVILLMTALMYQIIAIGHERSCKIGESTRATIVI